MRNAGLVAVLLGVLLAGCGSTVRVSDASTGLPVAGAQWRCGEAVLAVGGADGTASLDPRACPRWLVTAPGYAPTSVEGCGLVAHPQVALTPAWLGHFADGGRSAAPAHERLPQRPPCPCRAAGR